MIITAFAVIIAVWLAIDVHLLPVVLGKFHIDSFSLLVDVSVNHRLNLYTCI